MTESVFIKVGKISGMCEYILPIFLGEMYKWQ